MQIAPAYENVSHILLVDDDRTTLQIMKAVLESPERTLDLVQDGEAALAAFRARRPDVVISDIGLPGMNGLSLLHAVRQLDLDVPVLLVNGAPELRSAMEAVRLGALSYLAKPLAPVELRREVTRAVHLSRLARLKRELLELSGRTDG